MRVDALYEALAIVKLALNRPEKLTEVIVANHFPVSPSQTPSRELNTISVLPDAQTKEDAIDSQTQDAKAIASETAITKSDANTIAEAKVAGAAEAGYEVFHDEKNGILGISEALAYATQQCMCLWHSLNEKLRSQLRKDDAPTKRVLGGLTDWFEDMELITFVTLAVDGSNSAALSERAVKIFSVDNSKCIDRELHLNGLLIRLHPKSSPLWCYRRSILKHRKNHDRHHADTEVKLILEVTKKRSHNYNASMHWRNLYELKVLKLTEKDALYAVKILTKIISQSPYHYGFFHHLLTLYKDLLDDPALRPLVVDAALNQAAGEFESLSYGSLEKFALRMQQFWPDSEAIGLFLKHFRLLKPSELSIS